MSGQIEKLPSVPLSWRTETIFGCIWAKILEWDLLDIIVTSLICLAVYFKDVTLTLLGMLALGAAVLFVAIGLAELTEYLGLGDD